MNRKLRLITSSLAGPALLALLGGCAAPFESPAGLLCSELAESECLQSAACTLTVDHRSDSGYGCQVAADHCESTFRQSAGTAQSCEARAGCEFVPGRCYCPPDATCVCGTGPPPRCQARALPPQTETE